MNAITLVHLMSLFISISMFTASFLARDEQHFSKIWKKVHRTTSREIFTLLTLALALVPAVLNYDNLVTHDIVRLSLQLMDTDSIFLGAVVFSTWLALLAGVTLTAVGSVLILGYNSISQMVRNMRKRAQYRVSL